MKKSAKIVIFVMFLFWAVSNTVAASLKNDAIVTTILTKCEKEFSLLPSTTRKAPEKNCTLSMITLIKLNMDQVAAFLRKGFVTEISQNKFHRQPSYPSHFGLDMVLILIECLSPFPVRLQTEFLTEKGKIDLSRKNSMEIVDSVLKWSGNSIQNFYFDYGLVKVDAFSAPSFLNATCVLKETRPAPEVFSSRFTFSINPVATRKPGKLDITPDNWNMRYYAEIASTPYVLKLCAPMLNWNNEDPEKWLLDPFPSTTPKAELPEEEEDAPNTWLFVIVSLSILILMICGSVKLVEWRQDREIAMENPSRNVLTRRGGRHGEPFSPLVQNVLSILRSSRRR